MPEAAIPASPLVIEREREVETLRAALANGRNGVPSVVLLVGEPGLGKSHLLRTIGADGGATVLRGYSLEADAPPYFAFRRAFARLDRAALGQDVSTDILTAAGVFSRAKSVDPAPGDRLAVFDALTELLIGLAGQAPAVLILDDMQWASSAAWEAVTYLVRAAEGARITVVLASRPEGIEPPNPGAAAVTELNRNRMLRLLPLRPLSEDGTARLVSGRLGSEASPALLAALVSRTAGNPFFVEEVLRGLAEAGQIVPSPSGLALSGSGRIPVPDTLRLAIWQRVARLPQATVEALHAAAVLGRVFELPLLADMLGQPAEWVAGKLRPAVRAGIVSEDAGRWSFVHDTLRDAIFEQAGEDRAKLHAAAARALGGLPGAGSDLAIAATTARHLREAGDSEAAIVASLQASRLALAAHAAEEALQIAGEAEELFVQGRAHPAHISARDVHLAVAQAAGAAADYQRAEAAWSAVLELTAEPAERARVLVSLATVVRKAERSDAAAKHFQEALVLLEDGSDRRTLIEALVELSTLEGTTRADYDAAVERGERALVLSREANDAGLEARAALALANARIRSETPGSPRDLLTLALDRALEANDSGVAAEAAASLSNSYYWTGDLRGALTFAARRLEIAEAGHDAFALRHAHSWLALLATTSGDWARAGEMIRQAEPAIARMGSPEPLGFLRLIEGLLALRTGEIDLALSRTEEAMRIFTPLGDATVSWYVAVRIWALLAAGRNGEAAQECAAQEARLSTMPESALPARSSRCGLGRAYVALGDLARAADCEAKLAPFAEDFHWRPARLTLAATAALRGDREESLRLLREVEAFAAENGLDYDLADTRRIISALESGAPAQQAFARPDAPPPAEKPAAAAPGGLFAARDRSARSARRRPQQPRNREPPRPERTHRGEPCEPHLRKDRRRKPGGRDRVRVPLGARGAGVVRNYQSAAAGRNENPRRFGAPRRAPTLPSVPVNPEKNRGDSTMTTATAAERKLFSQPDETRSFPFGEVQLVNIGGGTVGQLTLQPGWRWSEHVKPIAGTEWCEAPHFQYHVKGTLRIKMTDGSEFDCLPGDVTALPSGHDAWVVGNEPVVVVDFFGASNYAQG